MIRKILASVLLWVADSFVLIITAHPRPQRLLIIRTDALGDYILFRNYLKTIRIDLRHRDCRIVLACNAANRSLAELMDSEYVDDFIWIDRGRMERDLGYRAALLRRIRSEGFGRCFYPAYSREYICGDALTRAAAAKENYGVPGGGVLLPGIFGALSGLIYNRPIHTEQKTTFEFFRNGEIVNAYLSQAPVTPYDLNGFVGPDHFKACRPYAVLQPGAGGSRWIAGIKEWRPDYFALVAEHLISHHDMDVRILGVFSHRQMARSIMDRVSSARVFDLTGRTDTAAMIACIRDSSLLVSVETSAVHIAAALKKRAVCVSNGSTMGRFSEYPKELTRAIRYVYPPEVEQKKIKDYEGLCRDVSFKSFADIDLIHPDRVISCIDSLMDGSDPSKE